MITKKKAFIRLSLSVKADFLVHQKSSPLQETHHDGVLQSGASFYFLLIINFLHNVDVPEGFLSVIAFQ